MPVANDQTIQVKPTTHRRLSGRWIVALTLSLFLLVPVITYLAWQMSQGQAPRLKLDYDKRESWFMQPVKQRPLTYDMFVKGETGKEYKKTDLTLDPVVEQTLQRCVRMAKAGDFFTNTQVRDELIGLSAIAANGFYPPYLVASWYQVNGDAEAYERWMRVAFDRAEGALAQRLVTSKGQPVADYRLPPIAIGYDRVTDGKRDASLVLVYPAPISEPNGFIYLPTFRSIYRLTDPALPPGVDPGVHPIGLTLLPQEALGKNQPNWFAVPDGAVGRFKDAVLTDPEIEDNTHGRAVQDIKKAFGMRGGGGKLPPAEPQ